jgi:hypothetical protein
LGEFMGGGFSEAGGGAGDEDDFFHGCEDKEGVGL